MHTRHFITLLALTAGIVAHAVPEGATEATSDVPGGLTIGVHANDQRVRGMGDALIPVWQNNEGLVFINPRVSFNDDGEEEVNIGAGYRRLVADDTLIMGANLYYDTRWSMFNNRFGQVGAGLEILSSWIDARANYYYPDDKEETISSHTEESTASSTAVFLGTPIVQGRTTVVPRTFVIENTTTTRLLEVFETALEGFDAEIGARLPILTNLAATRLFIGYQSFDNPFGEDLEGIKGRLEIRIGEGLLIDAEVVEDEVLNRADFIAGVRVRLPFSIGNLVSGDNPFEGACAAFKTQPEHLPSRLGEMVMRDMNVRLGNSRETVTTTTSTTSHSWREDIVTEEPPPPPEEPPPPPQDEPQ